MSETATAWNRRTFVPAHAKLDAQAVRAIRAALAAGEQQKTLAARYGVSKTTISMIASGKRWGMVKS